MPSTEFIERQNFRGSWVWYIILAIDAAIIYAVVQEAVLDHPLGKYPAPLLMIAYMLIIVALSNYMLWTAELQIRIDTEGVHYRYLPLIRRERHIAYSELEQATVRHYSPVAEYGGWGYRLGLFGKGKALNVRGSMGLQLVLKNGKKLLLGTQQPEALTQALSEMSPFKQSGSEIESQQMH